MAPAFTRSPLYIAHCSAVSLHHFSLSPHLFVAFAASCFLLASSIHSALFCQQKRASPKEGRGVGQTHPRGLDRLALPSRAHRVRRPSPPGGHGGYFPQSLSQLLLVVDIQDPSEQADTQEPS